jgi:hypothetical protein
MPEPKYIENNLIYSSPKSFVKNIEGMNRHRCGAASRRVDAENAKIITERDFHDSFRIAIDKFI